ncbi:MAG TPA: hypothetical protein VIM12_12305 [Noviherbaspirillum sp.]|jgi:uncharacterized protein|uniref:hypothetical protein n=1 Tax=Noviherbaspirillum sp. TaxID=1926288 RepID=UPI002F93C9ED
MTISDGILPPGSQVPRPLIDDILANFRLPPSSVHGPAHWARVRLNGMQIARRSGADWKVIELFAFLHDSQRHDDGADPEHGPRAADYALSRHDVLFHLEPAQLHALVTACRGHTRERLTDSATVQACWDADRLDLYRVGILPDRYYLGTPAARDASLMRAAIARSRQLQHHDIPDDWDLGKDHDFSPEGD